MVEDGSRFSEQFLGGGKGREREGREGEVIELGRCGHHRRDEGRIGGGGQGMRTARSFELGTDRPISFSSALFDLI